MAEMGRPGDELLDGLIAPASEIRRRLAIALTEAGVLRRLLKAAEFLKKERQRLRKQGSIQE